MRFSERHGYKAPKVVLAEDEIPLSLRTKLWNGIHEKVIPVVLSQRNSDRYTSGFRVFLSHLAHSYFQRTIDGFDYSPSKEKQWLKLKFLETDFPEFFDLCEEVSVAAGKVGQRQREEFERWSNDVLAEEMCAFRFLDHQLAPISSLSEVAEVERAIGQRDADKVAQHISKAVGLFSKRPDPDYTNTVKEAISAVEAAAQYVTGDPKASLGAALRVIKDEHGLHPALKEGFAKIYGYTSDANGIRHALTDDGNVGEQEARFMLVSCSAFANYLIGLSLKDANS